MRILTVLSIICIMLSTVHAGHYYVATSGDDMANGSFGQPWQTVQYAMNNVTAGDTVSVRSGVYNELVTVNVSGNPASGYIVLRNDDGHTPILDGTGLASGLPALIKIVDQRYIEVSGFEMRNLITSNGNVFPAGIWIRGESDHILIRNNLVHHIEHNASNAGAHGIAVYGTSANSAIHDIVIDGNTVRDCILGWSEALVLNGNVRDFIVSNNTVHDCNNIAYDFIGFEGECGSCSGNFGANVDRARDGLVVGNVAYNIDTKDNPAYGNERSAAGYYVDGGANIIFERNIVYASNLGFELASEHFGKATEGIVVRNNFIYQNHVLGIATGGYSAGSGPGGGQANNNFIVNNTLYQNTISDRPQDDWGAEILLQSRNNNNVYKNNMVFARSGRPRVSIDGSLNAGNEWGNQWYFGSREGTAPGSVGSGDPLLIDPPSGALQLSLNSPAIDAGENLDSAIVGTEDIDGNNRFGGNAIDIGAHEANAVIVALHPGEELSMPKSLVLHQNYPNPFNPSTVIEFELPVASVVTLDIFDIIGRHVVGALQATPLRSGKYKWEWNGADATGKPLAGGVYFYRLRADEFVKTRKMLLIR